MKITWKVHDFSEDPPVSEADWLPQADDAAQAPVGGVAWRLRGGGNSVVNPWRWLPWGSRQPNSQGKLYEKPMKPYKVVPPSYKLVYNPNNYRYNPLINPSYSTYKPT